ncbi:alpha/beta fold hydrolase [Leptolyngbya sp. AN02str]|uniref:alpha/beta fold hydrolase n=1 Tax=Leptolyngbya sp. AN02str TaxID=3423363 RepID=UPI003D311686
MKLYKWQGYNCAYDCITPPTGEPSGPPLLLIHPIGVGLSRWFWERFIKAWYESGQRNVIYNPDLLGCGDSDLPRIAYQPDDWGQQLQKLVTEVIQEPVVLVSQGALFPVALSCASLFPDHVKAIALSGPPAWRLMTNPTQPPQQKVVWNLFDTPLGSAFYQYARRRKFLESFSERQLFGNPVQIDENWLDHLQKDSEKAATRHAVFAFLAGFWRQDYQQAIESLMCPTLTVFGEKASSVTKGYSESAEQRLAEYLEHLPHGEGCLIPGRNVLPYESTEAFVNATRSFVNALS